MRPCKKKSWQQGRLLALCTTPPYSTMGRVRKYKKIKACDPNSKQNNGRRATTDLRHDDPPEEHDARSKRKAKALERPFDDLEHAEKMLQREAMRALRNAQTAEALGSSAGASAAKRDDETMRDFQRRIRSETKVALRDELQKLTKTAQKKKEHLRAKKLAKKQKRQHKATSAGGQQRRAAAEEEREYFDSDFNQRADGQLRPSDLGAPASFPGRGSDVVLFGERVVAPPDLKALGQMLGKKKRPLPQQQLPPPDLSDDEDEDDDRGAESTSQRRKRRKGGRLDLDALEGDHGGLVGGARKALSSGIIHSGGGRAASSSASSSASGSKSSGASVAEMEALRTRVQAAYKTLREKRRDEALSQLKPVPGARKKEAGRGFVMMSDLY